MGLMRCNPQWKEKIYISNIFPIRPRAESLQRGSRKIAKEGRQEPCCTHKAWTDQASLVWVSGSFEKVAFAALYIYIDRIHAIRLFFLSHTKIKKRERGKKNSNNNNWKRFESRVVYSEEVRDKGPRVGVIRELKSGFERLEKLSSFRL